MNVRTLRPSSAGIMTFETDDSYHKSVSRSSVSPLEHNGLDSPFTGPITSNSRNPDGGADEFELENRHSPSYQASQQFSFNYPQAQVYSRLSSEELGKDFNKIALSRKGRHRGRLSKIRTAQKTVSQSWLWEAGACVFSLLCLGIIVLVLLYEDGKQLDQWVLSVVSPTAVVSFIGTLAKTAIVTVLSRVLSQLKWLYFQDPTFLRQLRTLENGSRGPIGSALVIWRSKRLLASIAAVFMILTLLVDPFVQLVFTFPTQPVKDLSGSAAFGHTNTFMFQNWNFSDTPVAEVWSSINQGFGVNNLTESVSCSSGNCTWTAPITTLAVCGGCSNITTDVQVKCPSNWTTDANLDLGVKKKTCSWIYKPDDSTGNNISLDITSAQLTEGAGTPVTLWNSSSITSQVNSLSASIPLGKANANLFVPGSADPNVTVSCNGSDNDENSQFCKDGDLSVAVGNTTISRFVALRASTSIDTKAQREHPPADCWDCELYWCEKTYQQFKVVDGQNVPGQVSTERLWSVSVNTIPTLDYDNWWYRAGSTEQFLLLPSELNALTQSGPNLGFRYRLIDPFPQFLLTLFNSYLVSEDDFQDYGEILNKISKRSNLVSNPGMLPFTVYQHDLNETISRIAASLSEYVRTSEYGSPVAGQALVMKSFIKVQWRWLALPLAIMVGSCLLLLAVAVRSHSEEVAVWKDDPLALLCHRVNGLVLPGTMDKARSLDVVDELAEKLHVKLDPAVPFTFVQAERGARRESRGFRIGGSRKGYRISKPLVS